MTTGFGGKLQGTPWANPKASNFAAPTQPQSNLFQSNQNQSGPTGFAGLVAKNGAKTSTTGSFFGNQGNKPGGFAGLAAKNGTQPSTNVFLKKNLSESIGFWNKINAFHKICFILIELLKNINNKKANL